jgi:hypothetical protein
MARVPYDMQYLSREDADKFCELSAEKQAKILKSLGEGFTSQFEYELVAWKDGDYALDAGECLDMALAEFPNAKATAEKIRAML